MSESRAGVPRLLRFWPVLAAMWMLPTLASAQVAQRGFVDRVFRDEAGAHKYVVFVPREYTPEREWPVIMYLHGAGERGTDGRRQLTVGLGPYVRQNAQTFPFIVVFPQNENVRGRILDAWSAESPDGRRAVAILDDVMNDYRIDPERQILTGWSMGGYGAWSLGTAMPDRWAAVVPLAGGGDPAQAPNLKNTPVWAFHGAEDMVVPPTASRTMISALRAAGGNPRYDELPNVGHDVWRVAYESDALYRWMLNPAVAPPSAAALRVTPGRRPALAPDAQAPFVPALVIQNAGYARIGNDVFKAISYGIPQMISPDLLRGRINDISDYTSVEGLSFSVRFSGITYVGELARAQIQAYAPERLNVQLGLQNVFLTIAGTSVVGEDHSAVAGPITIGIGHQRPVWLSFDVRPYVQEGRLRLQLLGTRFDIPSDNWYVTAPAGVSTEGFGMTREKVSSGLVSGLYGSKYRIEQQVLSIVPTLVAQMEQQIQIGEATELVNSLWPLPVYRPRVIVWPQEVTTDAGGVSLVLGMTVAAVDPRTAPRRPEIVRLTRRSVADVPKVRNLRFGVAPEILHPLTEMLIDAGVARIHVQDIPEKAFARLADPTELAAAFPDLQRYGDQVEVWSELILAEPITVVDAPPPAPGDLAVTPEVRRTAALASQDPDSSAGGQDPDSASAADVSDRFELRAPKVLISLAIRTEAATEQRQPYAEIAIEVNQPAQAKMLKPDHYTRLLDLDWSGPPQIQVSARFAPGYSPENSTINTDALHELFATAWNAWTETGPASRTRVADIPFGPTRFRLANTGWAPPDLYVDFATPATRIENNTERTVVYETKGPYSPWGGPHTLPPGEAHEFQTPYPLTYRRRTDRGIAVYTLPVGTYVEFKMPDDGGPIRLFLIPPGRARAE